MVTYCAGATKSGKPYVIRDLEVGDTKTCMDYINELSLEQTFILRQGEQFTLEEEQKYIDGQIKRMQEHKTAHVVVECEGRVVGSSEINLKDLTHKHVGHLGISLLNGYRDEGIGSKLLGAVIETAKKQLTGIRMIELTAFAINPRALHLYAKFGFKEFGLLPKAILYKGAYVDEVYMAMELES